MLSPRFVLPALLALTLTPAFAGGAADPFASSSAVRLWTQVVPSFARAYVGRHVERLPADLDDALSRLRVTCERARYDARACGEDAAVKELTRVVRLLDDPHTFIRPRPPGASGLLNLTYRTDPGFFTVPTTLGTMITSVTPGAPAAQAGLRRGDLIDHAEVRAAFERADRTAKPVKFMVTRQGQRVDLTATDALGERQSMPTLTFDGDVAVIRIETFAYGGVAQRVHDLAREADARGARGVVVDLRGNPGGYTEECLGAFGAFVPTFGVTEVGAWWRRTLTVEEGAARLTSGRGPTEISDGAVVRPARFDRPLVVLVNVASASCAEKFAALAQHHGRGVIVGEETAGLANTGTRMTVLSDRYELWVTVSRHLFGSGEVFPEMVRPDVRVRDDLARLARTLEDVVLDRGVALVRERAARR